MNFGIFLSLASAAAGFFLAWQLQAHDITKINLEHANERISVARANRAVLERQSNAIIKAQNDAAALVAGMRRDTATARTVSDGLRSDTAAAVRTAASDPAACPDTAKTLAVVFDQCTGAFVEMAGHAQEWYIEALKLHGAQVK
jgi:hypothetical protein